MPSSQFLFVLLVKAWLTLSRIRSTLANAGHEVHAPGKA
jgi:hypothetical protein